MTLGDRWRRNDEARWKARRTRFMTGWDDAIAGRSTNPYHRDDYRGDWKSGYDRCMAGEPLPHWYHDWRASR